MKKSDKLLKNNLSSLVKKFSKTDVISTIEKEYTNQSFRDFQVNDIDDNSYLKKARVSDNLLEKIGQSIKEVGLKSPLILRSKKDHYEVVLGRKRLLACKKQKIETVPAVVIDIESEEMILMLLADIRDQRDGNVIEMALLCKELCSNFGYSQATLANFTHQSRCQITNIMRLLTLPDNVVRDISTGRLSYGHAKAIASLPDSIVLKIVDEIYKYNLSVREIESIVKRYKNNDKEVENDENRLNKKYNAKTQIKKKSITLNFESEEAKNAFILDVLDSD